MNICNDAAIRLRMLNNSDGLISTTDNNDSMSYKSENLETPNERPPNYFESETTYWITKQQHLIKPSAPTLPKNRFICNKI
jgi:hypothetical protein